MAPTPLRVRIHLNLGQPELAESAVRIQSPTGAWVTVAYATELLLRNCVPVVDCRAQVVISDGSAKKTPHAFLEGDLHHFLGRLRAKAPIDLVEKAHSHLLSDPKFGEHYHQAKEDQCSINYNPRFASCFYRDAPSKSEIDQRFISSSSMIIVGWKFLALAPEFTPMLPTDRCDPVALTKSSVFEHLALRKGRQGTNRHMASLSTPSSPARSRLPGM